MPKHWMPVESNPEVLNEYTQKMGLDTSKYSFYDVLSHEEWALSMVPRPVVAVLFLYSIKNATETHRHEEAEKIKSIGQVVSPNVYYMKQTVGNACGTVGVLHAIGNAKSVVKYEVGSYLDKFFSTTATMTPDEIAKFLDEDEEIEECHGDAAAGGQSAQEEDVNTHFICFM